MYEHRRMYPKGEGSEGSGGMANKPSEKPASSEQPSKPEKENQDELALLTGFRQDLLNVITKLQGPVREEYGKLRKSNARLDKYPERMSNYRDVRVKRKAVNEALSNSRISSLLSPYQAKKFPAFSKFCARQGINTNELFALDPWGTNPIVGIKNRSFDLPHFLERISRVLSVVDEYLRIAGKPQSPKRNVTRPKPTEADDPAQEKFEFEDSEPNEQTKD